MATLLAELLFDTDAAPARAGRPSGLDGEPGGERTLEALVSDAWEALAAGTAACPVCSGALRARFGAGAQPVGARCGACAAELG